MTSDSPSSISHDQQEKAEKELAKRRAKNLSAAAGSGQPSAQLLDTVSSNFQNKPELPGAENLGEPDAQNSDQKPLQNGVAEEDDSIKAEDLFPN